MNASAHDVGAASATETPQQLRFLIVYEDFACGVRAKRFADELSTALGSAIGEPALWRWELLEVPPLSEEALRDAAASDFVILSLRGDRHLSLAQKGWLARCLENAGTRAASLVALFDPTRTQFATMGGTREFLKYQATAVGVSFFGCSRMQPEGAAPLAVAAHASAGSTLPARSRLSVRYSLKTRVADPRS